MGPISGTLILRRRIRLPWLRIFFKGFAVEDLSVFSLESVEPVGAGLSSSAVLLLLRTGNFLSLGKNWYFLWGSGCCILQENGFSEGEGVCWGKKNMCKLIPNEWMKSVEKRIGSLPNRLWIEKPALLYDLRPCRRYTWRYEPLCRVDLV